MNEKFEGIVRLNFQHSLITKNAPPEHLTQEQVNKVMNMTKQGSVENGLFDGGSPNYHTYYPEVKKEDLDVAEGENLYPSFRFLSEVIVHKKHNPVDFSKPGVLKNSMELIKGQTVYPDHEPSTGNSLGAVTNEVEWQEGYKMEGGTDIPAGMNGILRINAQNNPRIVTGMMADPPEYHSVSVTVRFMWEMSHPAMDSDEFWSKLGTFNEDGELIRRVVTEILAYSEISLVPHGADPFAKRLDDDGRIIMHKHANAVYSLSADKTPEERKTRGLFQHDFADQFRGNYNWNQQQYQDSIANSETTDTDNTDTQDDIKNQSEFKMKNKLIALITLMGASLAEGATDEQMLDLAFTEVQALQNKLEGFEGQTMLDEASQEKMKLADLMLQEAKDECLRLYRVTLGEEGKEDKDITDMIESLSGEAGYKQCKVFTKQYATEVAKLTAGSTEEQKGNPEGNDDEELEEKDIPLGMKEGVSSTELAEDMAETIRLNKLKKAGQAEKE